MASGGTISRHLAGLNAVFRKRDFCGYLRLPIYCFRFSRNAVTHDPVTI
jgi:hypothetical protein